MPRRPPDPHDRLAALLARAGTEDEPSGAADPHAASAQPARDGPAVLDEDLEEPYLPGPQVRRGLAGEETAPRVLTLPLSMRGAVTRPAGGAVAGFAAVLLLAALVFGVRAWWAGREATLEPVPAAPASGTPPASPGTGAPQLTRGLAAPAGSAPARAPETGPSAPGAVPAGTGAGGEVYVHVVGKVVRPGVVKVPAGSRVVDALASSGGVAPGGDPSTINLARPVADGEQIVVLATGQSPPPTVAVPVPAGGGSAPAAGSPPGAASTGAGEGRSAGSPVNLNTADAAALETLPGVGPVLAKRILEWRAAHGRFSAVEELGEVSGVGPKTLERLTPLVTL